MDSLAAKLKGLYITAEKEVLTALYTRSVYRFKTKNGNTRLCLFLCKTISKFLTNEPCILGGNCMFSICPVMVEVSDEADKDLKNPTVLHCNKKPTCRA